MRVSSQFRLFLLIGVVCVGIGLFLFARTLIFLSEAELVRGEVVGYGSCGGSSVDTDCAVVRFHTKTGQEVTFTSESGGTPHWYFVGAVVDVAYDPDDPTRAEIHGVRELYGGGFLGCLLGAAFTLPYIFDRRKKARAEWWQQNGMPVMADMVRVVRDTSIEIDGYSPYRIICRWRDPASGQSREFKSDCVWGDPAPYLKSPKLKVFIDPVRPERSWVDTSFLPDSVQDPELTARATTGGTAKSRGT